MRIGILGTSEIALRRFLPALKKVKSFEFAGVASRDIDKTRQFSDYLGGKGYNGYNSLLDDTSVDCIYIPLPPALHFEWAKKALESGKHVMLEKPFTTLISDTSVLVDFARRNNLALHENYMFLFHKQVDRLQRKLPEIGELRLFRIDFGFPFRGGNDFRYDKALGGGALFDCGGYTLNLAAFLLGDTAKITDAALGFVCGFDVDIYGSATLRNNDGLTAQVSFGMDNGYRCSLYAWGSRGSLFTDRVFTAPDGFEPSMMVRLGDDLTVHKLPHDDSFAKSIEHFADCVTNQDFRSENYRMILRQGRLIDEFLEIVK